MGPVRIGTYVVGTAAHDGEVVSGLAVCLRTIGVRA